MARMRSGYKPTESIARTSQAAAQWDELETTTIKVESYTDGVYTLTITAPYVQGIGNMPDSSVAMYYGPLNEKLYFASSCIAWNIMRTSRDANVNGGILRFTIDARMRSGY